MSKQVKLSNLARRVRKCRKCGLWRGAKNAVFGRGPATAKIMIIGEAPGRREDELGKPFVGISGRFLDKTFGQAGIKIDKVFITSVIKHRPPKNRVPRKSELAACQEWWQEQIKIIRPKLIITLGGVAAKEVMGVKLFRSSVGKLTERDGVKYFPMYHPAAAMRFPKINKSYIGSLNKLSKLNICKE